MIVLIDNYDSFTYNLFHYLGELGQNVVVHRNDAITVAELENAGPSAIVISPGPCTPNEAGICLDVVKQLSGKIPILGVCLGHQAIGQAFGGKVVRAPVLMHGKVSIIRTNGRGVFRGLPHEFKGTRYHSLIVDRATLPDCFEITAETEDGIIMGMSHKTLNVHGVQFHPESIETQHGHAILKNFLELAEPVPA
ncbi:MAG TPA: aminodeoxychorismate/anthranilate synthase component II [Alphaproteobacteria bacterium]|nr:aminodeoxychorismate/anthranilate synthase component II [Alphaproteobacteria bacterium]